MFHKFVILVVDDSAPMRKMLIQACHQLGFKNTVEADDGLQAWSMLSTSLKIDFVISDWNMPQMSGLTLLEKIRKSPQFKSLPFLMVSGDTDPENQKLALKSGADGFLAKPFSKEGLNVAIENVLNNHTLLLPES